MRFILAVLSATALLEIGGNAAGQTPAPTPQTRAALQTYNNKNIFPNSQGLVTPSIVNSMFNQTFNGMGVLGDTNAWARANTATGPWTFKGGVIGGIGTLTPVVNVKDPQWAGGAKCDGTTDDTAALQAAFNGGVGEEIVLPPGTCNYTSLTLVGTGTHVIGAGPFGSSSIGFPNGNAPAGGTVLQQTTTTGDGLYVGSSGNPATTVATYNYVFENITILSKNKKTSGFTLHAHNAYNILFQNFQTGNDLTGAYSCGAPPCNNNYGGVWLDHAVAHFENSELWAQDDVLRINDATDWAIHYTNIRFGTVGIRLAGGAQGGHCTQSNIESNFNNLYVDQSQDANSTNAYQTFGAACAFDTSGGDNVVINTPLGGLKDFICDACTIETYGQTAPGNAFNIIQAPNYSSFTFTAGAGVGATNANGSATANLSGSTVGSVTLNPGSYGFWTAPTITFLNGPTGGCSVEPTATATVSAGAITAINLTSNGSGCSTPAPFVFIYPTGNLASGASATANLSGGGVGSVTVGSGGNNYVVAPTVSFFGGGCAVAPTANATVSGGAVITVTMVTNGSGCGAAPQIIFTNSNTNVNGNGIVLQDPNAFVSVAGAAAILQNGEYGIGETFTAGFPNNAYVDPSTVWRLTSIPNGVNMNFVPASCGSSYAPGQPGCPTTLGNGGATSIEFKSIPTSPFIQTMRMTCDQMGVSVNSANLEVLVGYGSAPTYLTSYSYTWSAQSTIPSSISTGGGTDAVMDVNAQTGITNNSTYGNSFNVQINNFGSSSEYKNITIDANSVDDSGNNWHTISSYYAKTTNPLTAIKVIASSGLVGGLCTITSGKL